MKSKFVNSELFVDYQLVDIEKGFIHKWIPYWISHAHYIEDIKKYCILIGIETDEDDIEPMINHEFIHIILKFLNEDSESLDKIWYKYIEEPKITEKMQLFLSDLTEYGLGFSYEKTRPEYKQEKDKRYWEKINELCNEKNTTYWKHFHGTRKD